ncbi:DNA polymerase III subunit delta [Veillonella sp. R32]|uniref:DNA polymerase III subunit delta n=1 Tax=Veillonella sp. R32 TaxID=2021312 RepID=UPI00138A0B0E|nr:DNA polymerase III subunit delta [Veillonella sp. R32]KAF1681390.1 DNA polymerase III subunit delta [Veillonella sp. R32]
MAIQLLYGDESQLIKEKKQTFFKKHSSLAVQMLNDEVGARRICEKLSEDSLFGEPTLYCLVNPPIFAKANKRVTDEWQQVYDLLLQYEGSHPVLILYHETLDKRLKANKDFLKAVPNEACERLKGPEIVKWLQGYCKDHGFTMSADGMEYIHHLLELWQDVPVSFLRTEFDRYFLLLPPQGQITQAFLVNNGSDYGAKNIFLFKEALFKKDVKTLLALFPYMLQNKEVERAMSYIEGQLRLQLMVSECRHSGLSERAVQDLFKEAGSTVKAYPITLAYRQSQQISIRALAKLLRGLYEVMRDSRRGEGTVSYFKDLCLAYCAE